MIRTLLAAFVAVGLLASRPAIACEDCKRSCPHHEVAGEEKKPAEEGGCACAPEGKDCQCGEKCKCPHCAKHGEQKEEKKT